MSHDLLARATESLRRTTAPWPDAPERETREIEGIIAAVRGRVRRRRLMLLVALQVALVTLGAGAWAATSGHLTEIWTRWTSPRTTSAAGTARPGRARPPVAAPARAAVVSPAPVSPAPVPEPVVLEPAPAVVPSVPILAADATAGVGTPVPRSGSGAAARISSRSIPAPARGLGKTQATVAATPAADLYQAAHQAHFVRRDWTAAVRAWDRYLAADKGGQLVPEARYNRALALARLGRADEAAAALQLFADGEYGSYRQDDARRLLDFLRQHAATGSNLRR